MSRVAIVEDHQLLAEILAATLARSGIEAWVVPITTFEDIAASLRARPADLVLLDLDLGELGDSTPLVSVLGADGLAVLVVTGTTDPMRVAAALDEGAIGYQPKGPGLDPLLVRITAALDSDGPLDPAHRVELLEQLRRRRRAQAAERAPFDRLTEREAETLRALARGVSVPALALEWYVSEATVRTHVRSILTKLGVSSQLAAVAAALRTGWLDLVPSG